MLIPAADDMKFKKNFKETPEESPTTWWFFLQINGLALWMRVVYQAIGKLSGSLLVYV